MTWIHPTATPAAFSGYYSSTVDEIWYFCHHISPPLGARYMYISHVRILTF